MCDRLRSAIRRVELREEEAIARIDQAEALQARYLRGLAVQKTFRETAGGIKNFLTNRSTPCATAGPARSATLCWRGC